MLEGPDGRAEHLLDVLPVDGDRVHAERDRPLGQVLDRQLLGGRRRLRVMVVLADVHGGHLPELREVQRLVEGADVRCPVTEERHGDARLLRSLNASAAPVIAGSPPPTTALAPRKPISTSYRCIEPP